MRAPNAFQQIYRSILLHNGILRHEVRSSTFIHRTVFREFAIIPSCTSTFRLCIIVHLTASSCVHVCLRGASYAVAHIFYFLRLRKIHVKGLNSIFCQRFEASPPRHPRGMYSRERFSPENAVPPWPLRKGNTEMSLFLFSKVGRYFKISRNLLPLLFYEP